MLNGLAQLGLEEDDLATLRELISVPYGMILVTGPIGSGKTTTLYSILNEMNILTANIVTIEDPVEYSLPGINQVQVAPKVGLTFAAGLRSILRQDANILMVGEIRDAETAAISVRAANTGHLLLSTLHTNDAVGAVTALHHLDVKPFLIGSGLVGVAAQRLVRKLCPQCREAYIPEAGEREALGLVPRSRRRVYRSLGCEACAGAGYRGRTGVFEVFRVSDRAREAIVGGKRAPTIRRIAEEEGMRSLVDNGRRKVLAGITSYEELVRVINM